MISVTFAHDMHPKVRRLGVIVTPSSAGLSFRLGMHVRVVDSRHMFHVSCELSYARTGEDIRANVVHWLSEPVHVIAVRRKEGVPCILGETVNLSGRSNLTTGPARRDTSCQSDAHRSIIRRDMQ